MQVICPAPRRKIQATQHLSSYCLCLHLDQFISNFRADFRFEPDTYQVEQRLGAYAGTNPRFVCDCFGDSKQLRGSSSGFTLVFLNTPLLPGIYFGMVLGLAIWFWVSRSAWKILTVLLSTVIAWVAAKFTAEHAFGAIQQMLEEIAAPGKLPMIITPDDQFYVGRLRGPRGAGRKHYIDIWPLARMQRIRSI